MGTDRQLSDYPTDEMAPGQISGSEVPLVELAGSRGFGRDTDMSWGSEGARRRSRATKGSMSAWPDSLDAGLLDCTEKSSRYSLGALLLYVELRLPPACPRSPMPTSTSDWTSLWPASRRAWRRSDIESATASPPRRPGRRRPQRTISFLLRRHHCQRGDTRHDRHRSLGRADTRTADSDGRLLFPGPHRRTGRHRCARRLLGFRGSGLHHRAGDLQQRRPDRVGRARRMTHALRAGGALLPLQRCRTTVKAKGSLHDNDRRWRTTRTSR
jgi:hypothetical protein